MIKAVCFARDQSGETHARRRSTGRPCGRKRCPSWRNRRDMDANRQHDEGYLNDEDATNAAFENGNWYRTGDVARLDDDGYLFIVDRLKDMIITGGENVYSKEIEDVLSGHLAVFEVAVYGIPHGDWRETVVATIVPKIRHVLNADDVREYLVGRLAKFNIPRQIHFLEERAIWATRSRCEV
jgi:acyl-CoA synthetase (AMP-forming)/AMP-acid ligase II